MSAAFTSWYRGGVILSEGFHYAAKKQSDKAYAAGYDKGKSDAVKQQYWLYVSMQRQRNQVSRVRLYPVQLPIGGAIRIYAPERGR